MRTRLPRGRPVRALVDLSSSGVRPWRPRTIVLALPLLFFTGYLLVTELTYFHGPWLFPAEGSGKLLAFLLASHVALAVGFILGLRQGSRGYRGRRRVAPLLLVASVTSLILLLPTSAQLTGRLIPDVVTGLTDPGASYALSREIRQDSLPAAMYARILAAPLLALPLPLLVVYWRSLRRSIRLLALLAVAGDVALYIAMGTNRAIANTVALLPWLLAIGQLAGLHRFRRRHVIRSGLLVLVLLVGFATFFAQGMLSRPGAAAVYGSYANTGVEADPSHPLIEDRPLLVRVAVLGLTGYLTQGYQALQMSLNEPWVPTWGVGHSTFLYRQAARITGEEDLTRRSYPVRLEKYGWDPYGNWSTIYPWIASDLSFPGTVVFVFFVGLLAAMSWRDALRATNPFAVAAFSQFCLMLYYFPANNQVMQSGEQLVAFVGILLLWLHQRSPSEGAEMVVLQSTPPPSPSSG